MRLVLAVVLLLGMSHFAFAEGMDKPKCATCPMCKHADSMMDKDMPATADMKMDDKDMSVGNKGYVYGQANPEEIVVEKPAKKVDINICKAIHNLDQWIEKHMW